MLMIRNEGQAIAATNYWDSEHARVGLVFVSWNAGAARVLLPDRLKGAIPEMSCARYAIISRGPWADQGGRDALEILFEDGSEAPYCLHIVAEQTDRMIPADNQGGDLIVAVWTREGKMLELPGKYREVSSIPCIEPWSVQ